MYQLEWARPPPAIEPSTARPISRVDPGEIESVYLLLWAEHCIECALPDCYRLCPLYMQRADGKCARFDYGIHPNRAYEGLFPFGADVSFRRWGKLEAWLYGGLVSVEEARRIQAIDRAATAVLNPISSALQPLNPRRRLNGAYTVLRDQWIDRSGRSRAGGAPPDDLLIEVWNPGPESCRVIVESARNGPRSRTTLQIDPGHNLHRIPCASLDVGLPATGGGIAIVPENDARIRLIFTWLDLVRYRPAARPRRAPAAKIKCVVWDLDNTLWEGTLVDDGAAALRLRPEAAALVRALDERGIVQSIASRNDHESAWSAVERFGLSDYFLHPMIHWGAKAESLSAIARALDLGLDTLALIDDSPVERTQLTTLLPEVRAYSDKDVDSLLGRAELDVPVSAESRARRQSYRVEAQRRHAASGFSGDGDGFLRSCALVAEVFRPREPEQIERCLELLWRSNQLNLTTHRYEAEEFRALLRDPRVLAVATACHDRFGEYGTVGFAAVDLSGEQPLLRDFVLSCRVARKRVENAWFQWLLGKLAQSGKRSLSARFVPTERNGALREVLGEIGFAPSGERLLLDGARPIPAADVVAVREREPIA
jgi:FkbH-like protein